MQNNFKLQKMKLNMQYCPVLKKFGEIEVLVIQGRFLKYKYDVYKNQNVDHRFEEANLG